MKIVSQEEMMNLRRWVDYCPETGIFRWKPRPLTDFSAMGKYGPSPECQEGNCRKWNAAWAGKECFNQDNGRGYLVGVAMRRNYQAHRLAWALHYGDWPVRHVDHVNRIKTDNRISNLRLASASENQANTGPKSCMYSDLKGASFHKGNGRWIASIRIDGRRTHLGYFDTAEDAAEAYRAASLKHFGRFSVFAATP